MKNSISLVLLSCSSLLSAQESSLEPKNNQIEVFYSVSEFFDGSPTNWLFLEEYDFGDDDQGLYLPFTFGLQYAYRLNPSSQLQLTGSVFHKPYFDEPNHRDLQVVKRDYFRFSARYLRRIFLNQQGSISLLGGINYCDCVEFYEYPSLPILSQEMGTLRSYNLGVSTGVRMLRQIYGNFYLSIEASYTRNFLFIDKYPFNVPKEKSTSPQNLTLKYGLGYQF